MAELIPLQYKLRVAQKEHLARWVSGGVLAATLCVASLVYTYVWQRQQARAHDAVQAVFQEKSSLMLKSEELQARRSELAGKMQQVQSLMDDKLLLSLLRNISDGFGSLDCLEYVSVESRTTHTEKNSAGPYLVHVTGITSNSTTLAELMTRLGRLAAPAAGGPTMNVLLESSRRENLYDGQVMRFQILCQAPQEKGL